MVYHPTMRCSTLRVSNKGFSRRILYRVRPRRVTRRISLLHRNLMVTLRILRRMLQLKRQHVANPSPQRYTQAILPPTRPSNRPIYHSSNFTTISARTTHPATTPWTIVLRTISNSKHHTLHPCLKDKHLHSRACPQRTALHPLNRPKATTIHHRTLCPPLRPPTVPRQSHKVSQQLIRITGRSRRWRRVRHTQSFHQEEVVDRNSSNTIRLIIMRQRVIIGDEEALANGDW